MSGPASEAHSAPARTAAGGRSRIMATVFALGAFAIVVALGMWQLQRRDWKNDLIARFEAALSRPAVPYRPPQPNGQETQPEFTRVTASGVFEDDKTVRMLVPAPEATRLQNEDGFGYLLFTPLELDGKAVFVNRGFAPRSIADAVSAPRGQATVTGIVRRSQQPGWFTPAPEPGKRIVYSADIPAMAEAAGLSANRIVQNDYIEAEPSPKAGEWPNPRDPRELLAAIPNRHLEYALTWFGLAAALAGVYGVFIARS